MLLFLQGKCLPFCYLGLALTSLVTFQNARESFFLPMIDQMVAFSVTFLLCSCGSSALGLVSLQFSSLGLHPKMGSCAECSSLLTKYILPQSNYFCFCFVHLQQHFLYIFFKLNLKRWFELQSSINCCGFACFALGCSSCAIMQR